MRSWIGSGHNELKNKKKPPTAIGRQALKNLLEGKPWDLGLYWGRGHTASSVVAGLTRTLPALYQRGLIEYEDSDGGREPKLTEAGRREASRT